MTVIDTTSPEHNRERLEALPYVGQRRIADLSVARQVITEFLGALEEAIPAPVPAPAPPRAPENYVRLAETPEPHDGTEYIRPVTAADFELNSTEPPITTGQIAPAVPADDTHNLDEIRAKVADAAAPGKDLDVPEIT
ncbi:MAG TPA: hypothetical protein VLE74_03540 [Candidatus Saccharimonadales bacterium]|nr:hypothetical protein [Candidatus Saccharimonadales bacterium]